MTAHADLYRRAAAQGALVRARRVPSPWVDGRWVDAGIYRYTAERLDAHGRVVACAYQARLDPPGIEEIGEPEATHEPASPGLTSPDGKWILTQEPDEAAVAWATPGDVLPRITLVAIEVASGRRLSFSDCVAEAAQFSPFSQNRVWFGGPDEAWFVRLDRYARKAELMRLDLTTGRSRPVITEVREDGWIDLNISAAGLPNVRTLARSREVVWFSERDGRGHLYLYDADSGALRRQVTTGDYVVRDLLDIDEGERRVWFLAAGLDRAADPARRVLCSEGLDGADFQARVRHEGDIGVGRNAFSPDHRFVCLRMLDAERGDRVVLHDLKRGAVLDLTIVLPEPGAPTVHRFEALAADGATPLHGIMVRPSDFDPHRRYPLIDLIYPGPQIACQPQAHASVALAPARSIAELGFVVVMLDTRGMPVGDRAFRQAGYGSLLEPQLADHAGVMRQLARRHAFIDATRIGIVGESAGGGAAARAMFDYGDVYTAGVAICGVHDPASYSAGWVEPYCGPLPREKLREQANGLAAHRLNGRLLLVTGDSDVTVRADQTLGLADALVRADKPFDLLIVPGAGHDVWQTSAYAQRRVWDFLLESLSPEPPSQATAAFAALVAREFQR